MFSYSLKTELLDKRLEGCSSKDATLQVISRKNEGGRKKEKLKTMEILKSNSPNPKLSYFKTLGRWEAVLLGTPRL